MLSRQVGAALEVGSTNLVRHICHSGIWQNPVKAFLRVVSSFPLDFCGFALSKSRLRKLINIVICLSLRVFSEIPCHACYYCQLCRNIL